MMGGVIVLVAVLRVNKSPFPPLSFCTSDDLMMAAAADVIEKLISTPIVFDAEVSSRNCAQGS